MADTALACGSILLASVGSSSVASAASYLVGAGGAPEAPTLSAAVSVASSGDTLLVMPGTYVEVVTTSKSLVVKSSGAAGSAVINANNFGTGLSFVGVTGSVTVEGIAFQNGDGERGGGLAVDGVLGGVTVKDCEFFGNLADRTGGAIDAYDTVVEVSGCYFEGNGTNGSSEQRGGAIHLRGFNDGSTFTDCTFSGNNADYGGAIYGKGVFTVTDCTFESNSGSAGGAIYATSITGVEVTGCLFDANSSSDNGGGIYVAGTMFDASDNIFQDNTCGSHGGGIYLGGGGGANIQNNLFDSNSADKGGGVAVAGMLEDLSGNTFYGNSATSDGAGLYIQQTSATIVRNIFSDCTGAAAITCEVTASPSYTCTLVNNNAAGDFDGGCADTLGSDGNFDEDPQYCDAPNDEFGVDAASPAAPGNEPPECLDEGIGWGPVSCGATPRLEVSWGQVKSFFSEIDGR
ncbi:MAG: right-handed parallel beta-helix repeat-containing protein [Candidatus Eisenbacteria bacterium]